MEQGGIDLEKLICGVCHIQDDDKQEFMVAFETNKQVYILYQAPLQYNMDYLSAFKEHLKVRKAHNWTVSYHTGFSAAALL